MTRSAMDSAPAEREAVLNSDTVSRRFKLMDRVIAGNFASTVLLGAAQDDSEQIVIKVLMKSSFSNDSERRSALAEVAIHSAMIPHRNVLRLLAAEETLDAILLVTPFMPNGDLWSLMQYGQTFGEAQVRNCAAQMLSALGHLHDVCGLIHADIKPHNFLLTREEERYSVQLCDFGFTERPGRDGFVPFNIVRGTSGWFAPEMLQHRDYSFQLDLFGIGLIVFRMLGGYAPFDPPSRFQAKVEFDERCWSHIGELCRHLIAKLLRLCPAERGTAVEACEHMWICGPEPDAPTPQQLEALAAFGPPPNLDIDFCPVVGASKPCSCSSHCDAERSTVAPRSQCESRDDWSDFGESLPETPSSHFW